ncbi:MAG: PadR family transcriptional regulator [Candidatus Bathyarchaeota archaeon]|nr:PadR family transcriptional regulator [Candidatus Termiticorpusculum sp.]
MVNIQKEVQVKLAKGLLDLIILQFLNIQPMHGYELITKVKKTFGVYFGPSTVYPLLASLEKKTYISSHWNMESDRPRKVYSLTTEGHSILSLTENSLELICQKMGSLLDVETPKFTKNKGINATTDATDATDTTAPASL